MAKTRVPSLWDDPKNQKKLERLAKQKLFASEIGKRMGTTRNSIIGRARRTGVRLSYPEKTERLLQITGDLLLNWNKIPENSEFRKRCLKEAKLRLTCHPNVTT